MSAILYLAAVAYGIYTGAYGVAIICTGGILFEIAEGRKVPSLSFTKVSGANEVSARAQ